MMNERFGVANPLSLCAMGFIFAASAARADNYAVTTLASSGPGSLVDAVGMANAHPGGDTITFAPDLQGVLMVTSRIFVTSDLAVLGPASGRVTIDGQETNSGFELVPNTTSFTCTNMAFARCRPAILLGIGGLNLHIDRCSFTECATTVTLNPGRQGGAIALDSQGTAVNAMITNSTFLRNHSGQGGAIAANGGTQTIINCTFVENTAIALGGAIAVAPNSSTSEVLRISNCTLTGNMVTGAAANVGGGVFAADNLDDAFTCSAAIRNSILSGNSAVMSPDAFIGTSVIVDGSTGYNLIGDPPGYPTQPSDLVGVDPMLGPLQDNGGGTGTRVPLTGSPVIDHGAADPLVMFDQRGVPRPYDFPGIMPAVGGNDSDIGSVEVVPPPCEADFNHDGVLNSQDFFDFVNLFFSGC